MNEEKENKSADTSGGSKTHETAPTGQSGLRRPRPLPEPSVKTFVMSLAGQVLINLGLQENPATGKREQDLELAKYSIDLLQILSDKMRGNLTDEEQKLIGAVLYDLRMRYVEACR